MPLASTVYVITPGTGSVYTEVPVIVAMRPLMVKVTPFEGVNPYA